MKKVLIIRFSSIGDIILTSPIIRCVKLQTQAKLHFLIKAQYVSIVESNPYIDKIIVFKESLRDLINSLKVEEYDYIIDLQNSIRSYWVKRSLMLKSYTVKKKSWQKILFIYFGYNLLNDHVVDRYFRSIKQLNILNDLEGLDYFISNNINFKLDVDGKFLVWCIGASHEQKTLSVHQIVQVCNKLIVPCVLLGGKDEFGKGESVVQETRNKKVFNMCGKLSLDESSYYIQQSDLVLTGDTGLMHIAAAFQKKIISFWGCTKPQLGFPPYMADKHSVELVFQPHHRPCSKHGDYCRTSKGGCVKKIDPEEIKKLIVEYCQ
tara:strand:+ start:895 stop:1854 length:960 start_codon:yes stop_codon:yes gene_type:complete